MQVSSSHGYSRSTVTHVTSTVDMIVASDLFGSVNMYRLIVTGSGVVRLVPASVDQSPVCCQAACAISQRMVLVSAHPHGLIMLRHEDDLETASLQRCADKARATFEAGRD